MANVNLRVLGQKMEFILPISMLWPFESVLLEKSQLWSEQGSLQFLGLPLLV